MMTLSSFSDGHYFLQCNEMEYSAIRHQSNKHLSQVLNIHMHTHAHVHAWACTHMHERTHTHARMHTQPIMTQLCITIPTVSLANVNW